jgi:hypothetical protein
MSIQNRFSERLAKALSNAEAPVQQAFLQIIEAVAPHCLEHHGTNRPDYRFYNELHFCGVTPQRRRIKVGITNQDAKVSSPVFDMRPVKRTKWAEFSVDPTIPAQIHEAIRVIVEVSRALGTQGAEPNDATLPAVPVTAIVQPQAPAPSRPTLQASQDKLQVRIGEDKVIIPLHKNPGPIAQLKRLGDGSIVANTIYIDHLTVPGKRSRDGGQTWQDAVCLRTKDGGQTWNQGNLEIGESAFEYPDGEAVMFYGWLGQETEKDGCYAFPFRRWTNHGEKQYDETATIILPQKVDKGQAGNILIYPNHSIISLRDGSLLASVQGRFPYSRPLVHGGWRVFTVRSTDHGKTWHYLSTVATDDEGRYDDGFCEPVLLRIPTGNILCIMRTGGLVTDVSDTERLRTSKMVMCDGNLRFICDPMQLSVSKDDAMSWSEPRVVTKFGVYPNAVLMSNGVIALCYGRPGNWMSFSLDYGRTWGHTIQINDAPESADAGHYNSMVEVEPGKLLLVYAQGDPAVQSRLPQDHTYSEIRGTFIYVNKLE